MYSIQSQSGTTTPKRVEAREGMEISHDKSVECTLPLTSSGQQARLVFELPVRGEGHPEGFESIAREGRRHGNRLIRWETMGAHRL